MKEYYCSCQLWKYAIFYRFADVERTNGACGQECSLYLHLYFRSVCGSFLGHFSFRQSRIQPRWCHWSRSIVTDNSIINLCFQQQELFPKPKLRFFPNGAFKSFMWFRLWAHLWARHHRTRQQSLPKFQAWRHRTQAQPKFRFRYPATPCFRSVDQLKVLGLRVFR